MFELVVVKRNLEMDFLAPNDFVKGLANTCFIS